MRMVGRLGARAKARELSLLECALLALLRQSPSSGYDLRKVFAETPLAHFSDSPGAVYPALARLEHRGLLSSSGGSGGRKRRALRPTTAGHGALRQWLRKAPTRADLLQWRDAPMLRFAFMEEVLGREACRRFLVRYGEVLGEYVRELEAYGRDHLTQASSSGRLAFDSGVDGFRAQRRWVERALRTLAKEDS